MNKAREKALKYIKEKGFECNSIVIPEAIDVAIKEERKRIIKICKEWSKASTTDISNYGKGYRAGIKKIKEKTKKDT